MSEDKIYQLYAHLTCLRQEHLHDLIQVAATTSMALGLQTEPVAAITTATCAMYMCIVFINIY